MVKLLRIHAFAMRQARTSLRLHLTVADRGSRAGELVEEGASRAGPFESLAIEFVHAW